MDENELEDAIREKIYRELHTPVINRLLGLGLMASTTVSASGGSPATIRSALARMDKELRAVIYEIRRIVAPPFLRPYLQSVSEETSRDLFLRDLEKDIRKLEGMFDMRIELSCAAGVVENLRPQQFITIQDIFGNWLYNVGWHAKAYHVLVDFRGNHDRVPTSLFITFTDDGNGDERLNDIETFILELPEECQGLRLIQAAVARLGAVLQINSFRESGTTLTIANVPLVRE